MLVNMQYITDEERKELDQNIAALENLDEIPGYKPKLTPEDMAIRRTFARAFATPDGKAVLQFLIRNHLWKDCHDLFSMGKQSVVREIVDKARIGAFV